MGTLLESSCFLTKSLVTGTPSQNLGQFAQTPNLLIVEQRMVPGGVVLKPWYKVEIVQGKIILEKPLNVSGATYI